MLTEGKTILFLGDSITQGHGASEPSKNYVGLIRQEGDFAQVVNYGVGGSRIAEQIQDCHQDGRESFVKRAQKMQEQADIIVVFGGTNDYGHGDAPLGHIGDKNPSTFCGAVTTLLEYLLEKYPEAKLLWLTPIHRANENKDINEIGIRNCATLKDYVDAEKELCEKYGVPVLDLYSTSGICPDNPVNREKYAPDGLHPNDAGYRLLADKILQFIKYSL